jgi:predicted 2-oxoglutarate/Fe(II)-dependent dioxygenase YbiX
MFDIAPERIDTVLCEQIIAELAPHTSEKSVVLDDSRDVVGRFPHIRRSRSSFIKPDHWIARELVRIGSSNLTFPLEGLICQSVQFTIYDPDDMYDWHTDCYPVPMKEGCPREWVGLNRRVSLSANIAEPNSYGGGDLQFCIGTTVVPNDSGSHRLRGQGTVIVFPSATLHRVTPVTRGVRYSLVSWFLG